MAIYEKFDMPFHSRFRDVRSVGQRLAESLGTPSTIANIFFGLALALIFLPLSGARFILAWIDVAAVIAAAYMCWFNLQPIKLPFKMPAYAHMKDPKNPIPGKDGVAGASEGILFLGNERDPKTNKELWLTNSDARTHILFLGTTGTGKTEGLKSLVSNSLVWGSGFIYVDGKADTDLWANLYSLARRFGRDDDILVLNYMTGNSDDGSTSNTFNPFATGSSSYLSNMLTNLMPDAGGDNAMWKERAVALMFALMPALTFKRDKQGLLLDISVVRDNIELKPIVRLSRDSTLPERIIRGLQGYLSTLPGYVDDAFDDDGNEKPPSPDAPMYDLQIARQQHGYLSMQFTRAMQSLGDEYSYIFRAQLADVDVIDVVLQRRMLIGLIPSLEKSGDEAANLGKIIASTVKGMMGSTLGATVEGTWEDAIESKATRAPSPYMTVFDEVGYYVAQGMAVMAAQARSLGFSLVFAAQDLPAMEKRVKLEAQSILGNCNLKIFGKLEDPLESKKFFEEHVGTSWVYETQGFNAPTNLLSSFFVSNPYIDNRSSTGVVLRPRAAYDHLRKQREGQVHMLFHEFLVVAQLYHAEPKRVAALRVQKMLPVPSTTTSTAARERMIADLSRKLEDDEWVAAKAMSPAQTPEEVTALSEGFEAALKSKLDPTKAGVAALASISGLAEKAKEEEKVHGSGTGRVVIENEDEMLEARPPAAPASRAPRRLEAEPPPEDYGEPQDSVTPSGFEESFDYRPRTASRLSKMGVGVEDVAAIKPEDVSVLSQEGDIGKLKDLPPEAVAELKKGARNLSDALFNEPPPDGE
jgi:intracellular multiplication protein IcmO